MKTRNIFIFIICFIFIQFLQYSYAEINVDIIGEHKQIDDKLITGLENYFDSFSFNYYFYKSREAKEVLNQISPDYLPFVIYDKDSFTPAERRNLKQKGLIEESNKKYFLPRAKLTPIIPVRLLNRKKVPNQLSIFLMSLCPYGEKSERKIVKFIKDNNLPIDLKLYFIADLKNGQIESMHGVDEVEENIHQLLIKKYWPDKFFDYILLTKHFSRFQTLKKVGISYEKIDSLREKGKKILKENIKLAQQLDIHASPTFLWENIYLISGWNNIRGILEDERYRLYKEKHPVIEYTMVGLNNREVSEPLFDLLEKQFRIKGTFIPFSSVSEKFIKRFGINYVPFIFIDNRELTKKTKNFIREKTSWLEIDAGYLVPIETILEISPVYLLNRVVKEDRIDIIAGSSNIKRLKQNRIIKSLSKKSKVKVKFHKKGYFSFPELYDELGIIKLPIILWENQYVFSKVQQLLSFPDIKQKIPQRDIDKKIIIDFFGSPSCSFCRVVKKEILPDIENKYKDIIDIIIFDTLDKNNHELMLLMEEFFDVEKRGIPKIFIGDKVLVGKNDIEKKLENEIIEVLMTGKKLFSISDRIEVDYFYKSSDFSNETDKDEIINEILPQTKKRYHDNIEINSYDIDKTTSFNKLLNRSKKSSLKSEDMTPVVFINDISLKGKQNIKDNIDRLIQEKIILLSDKKTTPGKNIFLEKFGKFTLPGIIIAGLLDGINPCAFTVIVFFMSFLAVSGYKRKQVIYIGSSFIFSVFLAYFLIGLGLFSVFYKLAIYNNIANIFHHIIIFIVFLLAGLNLYDFVIYKLKKRPENVLLQLPYRIKLLIHKIIGKGYRTKNKEHKPRSFIRLMFIAFVVGFAVSVLESICTGQVYFPTIALLTQLPDILKAKSLFYLFVYNLMFVIPLIIIFLLALLGATSEQFSEFIKNHLPKIKFLTAIFFLSLGYLLIVLY